MAVDWSKTEVNTVVADYFKMLTAEILPQALLTELASNANWKIPS